MQGAVAGVGLASARQLPAGQGAHADAAVAAAPPSEYEPAAHGFAVADPVPAGQK